MARFKTGDSDDESSDSDFRRKRRKPNPSQHPIQLTNQKNASASAPAAPSAFAAKMMAKMGYKEGQGLGAAGRGRLAPIETQLRPQGAGLGAVKEKTKQAKEEEKREATFRGETLEDSSDEERKRKKLQKERKLNGVSRSARAHPVQAKPKYRTAADIEAAAGGLEIPNVLKMLIDATGSENRLLTSTAGLMTAQSAMIPAETEMTKISRMAQRESIAYAEEWRALQERSGFFDEQDQELRAHTAKEDAEDVLLNQLIEAVSELESIAVAQPSWDSMVLSLEHVLSTVDVEKNDMRMEELVVAAIHPLVKDSMLVWDPLSDPVNISPYLDRLKSILLLQDPSTDRSLISQDESTRLKSRRKATSHYETMLYTFWLPPMRTAIAKWSVHQPEILLQVIEAWKPVLPAFILANVIDQLVVHRLATAIQEWKPKRSRDGHARSSSPEYWLSPWLHYLDEQHTDPNSTHGLLADVKRRLKSALSSWDIGMGLFPSLQYWQTIFSFELPHILVRYILPRLAEYFTITVEIDPSDQDMVPLDRIFQWVPFFSLQTTSQLFSQIFFKKWHHILYLWLIGNPDHAEIMRWYQWWKAQLDERLPDGFNEQSAIAACWEKGLMIINVALDAAEREADMKVALAPLMAEEAVDRTTDQDTPKSASTPAMAVTVAEPTTFKDVVEDWCAENGVLIFPMREADVQSGLPLFRITASASGRGGCIVYLKGDVLWVRDGGKAKVEGERGFVPMALDDGLLRKAEGS